MSAKHAAGATHRLVSLALAVAALGLALSGCREVETAAPEGYQPARIETVEGLDVQQVTLTAEAARRVSLRTEASYRSGRHTVVPYASLIYDGHGQSWVYTNPGPLTFLRTKVFVDRVEGDRVLLAGGLPAGVPVVTVGATEVYGAELDIAGGH